ncbi:uncharacterized protein PAC_19629 [Phialocephala subalpina]|uniref:Uncharacterized protein n=1 Tax=Phialocephala subalpina TaxID=576137 RepID=A0A1L7XXK8_9HELO|nr:uncharacterized protein PAC_19629 [Phialocephala subalpina]
MRSHLRVEIKEQTKQGFGVEITDGTGEDDTSAVRKVKDLICETLDTIEMSYPKEDERERYDSHEDLKILAIYPA